MNKRILVADDDLAIRSLLRELLEEAYEVETASDGLVAWERLSRHPGSYEAIVLDMHMPRMNGLQLIQTLREQQGVVMHSVIALSSDSEALQQAAGMGVSHMLEKPFDLEAVLALVAVVLTWKEDLAQSF